MKSSLDRKQNFELSVNLELTVFELTVFELTVSDL